jgi:hypothetical protein
MNYGCEGGGLFSNVCKFHHNFKPRFSFQQQGLMLGQKVENKKYNKKERKKNGHSPSSINWMSGSS